MPKKTEVKCDGMMLTAGFHAASPPLIWRFDLRRNHSFTLALQGEEGDWDLGLTSPKGEFHSIVHFLAREDADEAFAKIEKVLSHKRGAMVYIARALLIVFVAALLILLGIGIFVRFVEHKSEALLSPPGLPFGGVEATPGVQPAPSYAMPGIMPIPAPAPKARQDGVPESADDILQPPQ